MYAIYLTCLKCEEKYEFSYDLYVCPKCNENKNREKGILDVIYDYSNIKKVVTHKRENLLDGNDMFRYMPFLPIFQKKNVLNTGRTPLILIPNLTKKLGLKALYIKDETRNPTRCLKDRATALNMIIAAENNKSELYCASAGNAAISLAGFSAYHGLNCHVFVPNEVSETRLNWLKRFGANIYISKGNYDQAFDESEEAGKKNGWYSRNCAYNPFLVEGKKTVAFEIAEDLNWQVPDMIFSPVGDGCILSSIGKGFRELEKVGLTSQIPVLVGVQSSLINPIEQRLKGESFIEKKETTQAASISVRNPRNFIRLENELKASAGSVLSVTDEEIENAQKTIAEEAGIIAEFTSAATLAGLMRHKNSVSLENKSIVLVVTGGRVD